MFTGVSVIDDLGHRIPALGPKALGLECGALGRQYPLTPSNMGLEYLILAHYHMHDEGLKKFCEP